MTESGIKSAQSAWLRLVNGLSLLYALGLVSYLLLRVLVGDGWWWLAFLHNFTIYYFAPLVVLLPLAVVLRQRVTILRLLPLLLIALITYGPYWLPRAQSALATDAPAFKVITFNVLPDLRPMAEVADWLQTEQADLVLLQELPTASAAELRTALADSYAYSDDQLQGTTQLTVSRHEILSAEEIDLGGWWIRRLVVNLDGRELAVYNVHMPMPTRAAPASLEEYNANGLLPLLLSYDETRRNAAIRTLLARLQNEPLPYIVAGDFNISDQAVIYGEMAAVMGDSFREAAVGLGATFPAEVGEEGIPNFIPPLIRIDYVWHSPHLLAVNAATGPVLGSDHLPLVVHLAWQPATELESVANDG